MWQPLYKTYIATTANQPLNMKETGSTMGIQPPSPDCRGLAPQIAPHPHMLLPPLKMISILKPQSRKTTDLCIMGQKRKNPDRSVVWVWSPSDWAILDLHIAVSLVLTRIANFPLQKEIPKVGGSLHPCRWCAHSLDCNTFEVVEVFWCTSNWHWSCAGVQIPRTWKALNVYSRQYFDLLQGTTDCCTKGLVSFRKTVWGIALVYIHQHCIQRNEIQCQNSGAAPCSPSQPLEPFCLS